MSEFYIDFDEDSTPTILGRLTAPNGTGAATGKPGEGNFCKIADIDTLSLKIYDKTEGTLVDEVDELEIDEVVLDDPDMTDAVWTHDEYGCNFKYLGDADWFADGEHIYRLEFTCILTGGGKFHGCYEGPARPIDSE